MRIVVGTVVILLVVLGVAAVLTGATGFGFGTDGEREASVSAEPAVLEASDLDDGETVVVSVVDGDGDPIESGQVRVESGSATLAEPQVAAIGNGTAAWHEAGGDPTELAANEVGFVFGDSSDVAVSTATHENRGSLEVHVLPPEDADYQDETDNAVIEVIDA